MWNNRWKGLKVDCIDGNYYVRLRDLEELEETIWNDISKRFDELNAEYSEEMPTDKMTKLNARIDELVRMKKYLNNLNRS
jgi:hypothetical protein